MKNTLYLVAAFILGAITIVLANPPTTKPTTARAVEPDLSLQSLDEGADLMLFKDIPIVVAAARREQTQRQAAASVSIVDANDIWKFGYRSLADILRDQRSFYLHTDGLNWFAGVRGFLRPGEWNARLTVLIDGRPTRENIYNQTHLDQDFVVPIETMKRVEVIRGPGSALYGNNAVFSVINVVTKDGADVNGVEAKATVGTDDTARGNILFGKKFDNGWDVIGDISAYTSQGQHDIHYDGVRDAAHNFGNVVGFDAENVDSAFLKLHKGEFTATYEYETRLKDNRSATYFASFNNPGDMHEDRSNITLRVDHEVSNTQSLHVMAYYGWYGYRQTYYFDNAGQQDHYLTESGNDWVGGEVHYDWQLSKAFHLTVGADVNHSLYTRQIDRTQLEGQILDIPKSYNAWALFADSEYKVNDWLTLAAGIRMDSIERIGTQWDPRFAVIITPNKEDAIKLLYGRAFRAPNLYEMFYTSPGINQGNPNLKPEIVDTYELIWERETRTGWHSSVGGFIWSMKDAMDNTVLGNGALQVENGGTVWARGIELEIGKKWENGASARAYATFTRAEHGDTGLPYSPAWTIGSAVTFPILNKRTFLAIDPQIVGGMTSETGDRTDPTFITNIVLTSREIVKGMDLQVGLYNLFGNYARLPSSGPSFHFQPTLNYAEPQLMVSLSYKF